MTQNTEYFHDKYDIKRRYRHPQNYDTDDNRPPDWDERKQAVYEMYGYQCRRCHRDTRALECPPHAHHYRPLHDGGTNDLDNLVLLCGHCHDAIHSHSLDLGEATESPVFPHQESDNRVAVVREPIIGEDDHRFDDPITDVKILLDALETHSNTHQNSYTVSESPTVYAIAPQDARDAQFRLREMVSNRAEKSADEIVLARNTDHPRPPDDVYGITCPRCGGTRIEDGFAAFPVAATSMHLTVARPGTASSDVEYYPVCTACAKAVYQAQEPDDSDVVCFGDLSMEDLRSAESIPSALSLKVSEDRVPVDEQFTLTVTDETGQPLQGVTVESGSMIEGTTDEHGELTASVSISMPITVRAAYTVPTLTGTEQLTAAKQIVITDSDINSSSGDRVATDATPRASTAGSESVSASRSRPTIRMGRLKSKAQRIGQTMDHILGRAVDAIIILSPLLVWFTPIPNGILATVGASLILLVFALMWILAETASAYVEAIEVAGALLILYVLIGLAGSFLIG